MSATDPTASAKHAWITKVVPQGIPEDQDGLFGEQSILRKISSSNVAILGGGAALLLEIAHPLVAAGVAEYSDFYRDPFGRLQRTLKLVRSIVFGSCAEAMNAATSLDRSHQHIRGTLQESLGCFPQGSTYHGRDPELVRWIWATLAYAALAVYENFVASLHSEERNRYFAEHSVLARALGVPTALCLPDDAVFRHYFYQQVDEVLVVGSQAEQIAKFLLNPATGADPTGGRGILVTSALLPPALREAFGLPWGEREQRRFASLQAGVIKLRGLAPKDGEARKSPLDAARGPR